MKRYLITAVALLAAGILSLTQASAQTTQKQQTFESFTGISVSGDFQVTLTPGTEYSAMLTVDEAVMRVLQLKNELGLFENPYHGADEEKEKEIYLCPAHREIARRAA